MNCHLRVARPVSNLTRTRDMYCNGLGLSFIGSFEDHEGFDGIMLGSPNVQYHFEFTLCRHHQVSPTPTVEDLVVFYEPDEEKWNDLCNRMTASGFTIVKSFNPYWDKAGKTFIDADGYRVVIQKDSWSNN